MDGEPMNGFYLSAGEHIKQHVAISALAGEPYLTDP
jgi:hypothetical protein